MASAARPACAPLGGYAHAAVREVRYCLNYGARNQKAEKDAGVVDAQPHKTVEPPVKPYAVAYFDKVGVLPLQQQVRREPRRAVVQHYVNGARMLVRKVERQQRAVRQRLVPRLAARKVFYAVARPP